MSKVITFDKGSKRRLKQVRWKVAEIFSVVLLAIFTMAIGIVVLLWQLKREHHYSQPPRVPQLREAKPASQ
jgi:hypothetical protein